MAGYGLAKWLEFGRVALPVSLAQAVLPASSVTLRTELTGPSVRMDRSALKEPLAETLTSTWWVASRSEERRVGKEWRSGTVTANAENTLMLMVVALVVSAREG